MKPLTQLLEITGAELHVLHVNTPSKNIIDHSFENMILHRMIKDFSPTYHFIENESFTAGINLFSEKNHIDLIITMPKKHGFFDSLFKKSHTKKLAFHSHLPLMVMHD